MKLLSLFLATTILSFNLHAAIKCPKEYVIDLKAKKLTGNQLSYALYTLNTLAMMNTSVGSAPDFEPGESASGDIESFAKLDYTVRVIATPTLENFPYDVVLEEAFDTLAKKLKGSITFSCER